MKTQIIKESISIKRLSYLQEEQSDEQEQQQVFLKLFQPRIDKFEHYN